ncbi:H/ACA ribonucleoprotein complex subunit GAR1 [Methanolobus vulcani]|uniref:H/ACA RNA-protein complex protein Gar1 n=1 Tax=Methanolobus vulcani TaxID=38026 RepID=A0A7Z8KNG7_9EURY|nr:Gar1/Naf1 family protein [Methanolobus vulcani]TQD25384.1 H/ACA RNA-protein complex protein Gar1 [Methanolobus vulcani]
MKRLGQILHISKQNEIVVRGDEKQFSGSMRDLPRINSFVLDKSIKPIGKVSGIFGPVDQPYFTLKPDRRVVAPGLERLVNERVYVQ